MFRGEDKGNNGHAKYLWFSIRNVWIRHPVKITQQSFSLSVGWLFLRRYGPEFVNNDPQPHKKDWSKDCACSLLVLTKIFTSVKQTVCLSEFTVDDRGKAICWSLMLGTWTTKPGLIQKNTLLALILVLTLGTRAIIIFLALLALVPRVLGTLPCTIVTCRQGSRYSRNDLP